MLGTGTLLDPFIIQDVNDLQDMDLDLTAYYELGNDIDASATVGWNGGLGFDPIGNYDGAHPEYAFTGNFDGKGYTITDLFINRPTEDFIGLFGYTGTPVTGWIRNVGLIDVDFTGKDANIGGLVGFHEWASHDITNCYTTGIINAVGNGPVLVAGLLGYNGSEVSDCHSDCDINLISSGTSGIEQNGGLIGLNDGNVTRCYATGDIFASGHWLADLGGLIGYHNNGNLTECYATGDITTDLIDDAWGVGGLVGENWGEGTVNCYARGNVTIVALAGAMAIGGCIGYNDITTNPTENCYSTGLVTPIAADIGGFCGDNGGTITDCFWDINTSGQPTSDGGTGKTTAEMMVEATFTGFVFGTVWGITTYCNDGYPCLINVTPNCAYVPPVTRSTIPIKDIVTLEAIRNVEMSAMGRFYVDEEGNAKYESRYARNP